MEEKIQEGDASTARWVGAASLAAVVASACCLGPVVLAGLGLSVAGLASFFEPLRPVFLVLTAGLLGGAFYFSYFRRPACAPGTSCAVDTARVRRTRTLLWVATLGVVLVALFPVYVGPLLRVGVSAASSAGAGSGHVVRLDIEGMTCGACAASIEKQLAAMPGVRAATVTYPEGKAIVETTAEGTPALEELLGAVKEAGYQARVARGTE
jgi:mercuric ion transport protein